MEQPYHKYVFDHSKREFVGKFEDMYRDEEGNGYDSWLQDDLSEFIRVLTRNVLEQYSFRSILDIGCGKGAFTHLLKKENNRILGVDISETAISKAKQRYPKVEWRAVPVEGLAQSLGDEKFDLVLARELLSYVKDWREVISAMAARTDYLFISLFMPPNPMGFVKSIAELKEAISLTCRIEREILYNNEVVLIMARSKSGA